MYYTYAIKSKVHNYIYVGITNNLQRRISQHNKGYNRSTKPHRPFELIYYEVFPDREKAHQREKYKSGVYN
ncbi:GIY-YIG nuclease family protein [Rosettibacter firmus]|uniref:GIY-YIG nuclease family protein n=1 Tax=Rosettibacter firmus TaxID=3111522 RepID=UPI00336BE02A